MKTHEGNSSRGTVFNKSKVLLVALLLCQSAVTGGECVLPTTGLIGWWRGEANGNDAAGNNNSLSLPNVTYTGGVVGQAFSFDPQNYPYGTYTGARIADQPCYALTNSLSVEAWVRPRGPGYVIFYRGDNRVGLDPYSLSTGLDNVLGFNITDADGTSASVTAPLVYNQWWHVAATLDGASGKMCLYTNGMLAAQLTTSVRPFGPLIAGDAPGIGIGNVNDGFNNFPFRGDIDEVALYNRAITAAEIAAIFNSGSFGKCPDKVVPFIVSQPASQSILAGDSATLQVTAGGSLPLAYQWRRDGAELADETKNSLNYPNAQLANAGTYTVVVTNSAGSVTSAPASLTINSRPACAPLPAGLVGWWRGDGNGNDSARMNNAYSLANVTFTGGLVGQSFAFDPQNYPYGTYTGVRVTDQPEYALTNTLTIEGWIRPRGPGYSVFYRGDNRPGLDPYGMGMGNNETLGFGVTDANGTSASVSAPLAYNRWWHVAGTLDGASGKLSLYTNGVLAAQITTSVRPFANLIAGRSPGIGIGNVNDGFNNFPFRGDIDEISLYNRALTPAELSAIYSAGAIGKCTTVNHPPVAQCRDVMVIAGTNCMADGSVNNGSYDPDGDALNLTQSPAGPYPVGTNLVMLSVLDSCGATDSCTAQIVVLDKAPPLLIAAADKHAECGDTWIFDPPSVSDACGWANLRVVGTVTNPLCGGTFAATRTWEAMDSSSNSAFCSQTVTVMDTLPPTIRCPAGLTVEFQDELGAVASYNVLATDSCSPTSLTALPASGNRFPIGVTAVRADATDSCGNSNHCAFTVSVLGAQGVKSNILTELTVLQSSGGITDVSGRKLTDAINHLSASLAPGLWIDQTHLWFKTGNTAINEEKLAAKALWEIADAKDSPLDAKRLNGIAGRIAKCDRLLAVISIHEAAKGGLRPKKVEQDLAMVEKGDREADAGRYDNAIEHYRNAWRHAIQLQVHVGLTMDGGTKLEFVGNTTKSYRIEVSSDMMNWSPLGNCEADEAGIVSFVDPKTRPQTAQFYRVVEQ